MSMLYAALGDGIIVAVGVGIVLLAAVVAYGRRHERWRKTHEIAGRDKVVKR